MGAIKVTENSAYPIEATRPQNFYIPPPTHPGGLRIGKKFKPARPPAVRGRKQCTLSENPCFCMFFLLVSTARQAFFNVFLNSFVSFIYLCAYESISQLPCGNVPNNSEDHFPTPLPLPSSSPQTNFFSQKPISNVWNLFI